MRCECAPPQAGGGGFQGFNHNQGQPSLSFPDMYGGAHSHLIQHHHTGMHHLASSAGLHSPAASAATATSAQQPVVQLPPPLRSTSTHQSASSASSNCVGGNSGKKKSPHFRWRRRKRRSKAQYPEMGQYLVPIDEGDEIQHLGRTLECTLCGLRGKRCHLTLHFKAKHSEVIDLNLHRGGLPPPPPPPLSSGVALPPPPPTTCDPLQ